MRKPGVGSSTRVRRPSVGATAGEFQSLFQGIPLPLCVFDRTSLRFLEANEAALAQYGCSRDELLSKTVEDIVFPQDRDAFLLLLENVRPTDQANVSMRHLKKDGSPVRVELSLRGVAFGSRPACLMTAQEVIPDLPESIRAQAALRESESRLRSIVDNSNEIIYVARPDGVLSFVSPAWTRVLGHRVRDVVGKRLAEFVHPDDITLVREHLARLLSTKETQRGANCRVRHADGSWRWLAATATPILDAHGEVDHIVGIAPDITASQEAELAIRQSEEKFSKVFYTSPEAVDLARLEDGQYLEVNRGFTVITGYAAEEVIGRTSIELGIWVETPERDRMVRAIRASGGIANMEVRFRRKNGEIGTGLTSATLLEVQGKTCLLSFTRDITGRKQMEQENEERRRYLERVLAAAPDAVIPMDSRHRIRGWNQGAEQLFGYTVDEAVGRDIDELLGGADPEAREQTSAWAQLVESGVGIHARETVRYRKDGAAVHVLASVTALETEDEPNGVLAIYTDVTVRKRAEEAVKSLNVELEERVAQRTEALQAANQELEAFASSVSHDLRAPLRSIDGFSRALEEDCGKSLDPAGQDHLKRVRAAAQRMGELIDGLLALSRIARTEMTREPVDLARLARPIAADLARRDGGRRIRFVLPESLPVRGDRRLLGSVLENLMENAWKFTARCAEAVIELGSVHLPGENRYFVRDNGVGFEMAYSQKLFNAFERLHRVEDFPGVGLGLANVQRIIRRHGGTAWAEGRPNEGATFWFTLPAVEQDDG